MPQHKPRGLGEILDLIDIEHDNLKRAVEHHTARLTQLHREADEARTRQGFPTRMSAGATVVALHRNMAT